MTVNPSAAAAQRRHCPVPERNGRGLAPQPPRPPQPPQPPTDPNPGTTRVFDGITFVWVPKGQFQMGSTSSEADSNERPLTQVRISRGFWMGKYEMTQDQWQAVMGSNPSNFSGCGRCPVEDVNWDNTQGFIRRLNARAGGQPYRLPTEAEWEYAATGGDVHRHLRGESDAAGGQ